MRAAMWRFLNLRETVPRVLVDCFFLCASLFLAFSTYLVGWITLWKNYPDHHKTAEVLAAFRLQNLATLIIPAIVIFALFGFYTRGRGYLGRFKAVIIFNAVGLTYLVHVSLNYILKMPAPRGAVLLGWVFSLALVGGSRLGKELVIDTFGSRHRPKPAKRLVRNVLVIGGAGYIGSVLVRQLLGSGFQVRVLDSLLFTDAAIASLRGDPRFELLGADFRHVESVVKAVQGMDAVIHLGAIVGDPACKLDNELSLETNLAATIMIKSVCRGAGIQRLLFASTCSVYGARNYLLDEKCAPEPISLYACTKIDSEHTLLQDSTPDFAPTVLRLATAFGWSYRPRLDLVVSLLTVRAIFDKQITIFNQTQWRPFIHVDDIARAFIACLKAPISQVGHQIFNVGSDDLNCTLGDLALLVKKQVPDLEITYADNPTDHRDYRVSFHKIGTQLNFTCIRDLEYGVLEIKRAVETGLIKDYRDAKYYNDRTLQQMSAPLPAQPEVVNGGASAKFLRNAAGA
jgi:nucleoside-diphosphate-sugar epimerase